MHLARVHVRVIVLVVDVVCLILVLSALVVLLACICTVSVASFSVVGGILFTRPVGDSKLRWLLPNFAAVTFCTKCVVRLIPQVNRPFTDFRWFPRSISVKSIVAVMSQMRDATRNLAIATKTRKSFATNFGNKLDPLHS